MSMANRQPGGSSGSRFRFLIQTLTRTVPPEPRLLGQEHLAASELASPTRAGSARRTPSVGYSGRMRNGGLKPAGGAGIIVLCFFLSGATGLVYQVVWLRLLGLVFGHTVYATTTVLSAFMAGLALGSLLAARRMARLKNLIAVYGWLEIGIGACCALVPVPV